MPINRKDRMLINSKMNYDLSPLNGFDNLELILFLIFAPVQAFPYAAVPVSISLNVVLGKNFCLLFAFSSAHPISFSVRKELYAPPFLSFPITSISKKD